MTVSTVVPGGRPTSNYYKLIDTLSRDVYREQHKLHSSYISNPTVDKRKQYLICPGKFNAGGIFSIWWMNKTVLNSQAQRPNSDGDD